jgi:GT2 family glycosyltransferase
MQFGMEKKGSARHFTSRETPYVQLVAESTVPEPAVAGWVNYASWLSDDILLIVGWFHAQEKGPLRVSLNLNDRPVPLEARCMSYSRPDLPDADPHAGKVITARFLRPEEAREPLGSLVIYTGSTAFALGPLELSQAMTGLQTLVRGGLAWLESERRAEVIEFLLSALTEHRGTANSLLLSKNLFSVREALRQRLPSAAIATDRPVGLSVDRLVAVDERSFYAAGWARAQEGEITRLTAVSPEGARVDLLDRAFRYPRADVAQFYGDSPTEELLAKDGFIVFFELDTPSCLAAGWVFEMGSTAGRDVEVMVPHSIRDSLTARNSILADLIHERPSDENLMLNHVFPAVSRLQKRYQGMVEVDSVVDYGTPNESPDISIIVPLYQRIDFLEQQLAQFVHDPEILEAELIYILDSPELADGLREAAAQLFPLYRVPFRVVVLKRNAGFATVNNVGARLAHGRLLLLLNSDVLPEKPGWLGRMIEFYDSTPTIGALGPKLLFEDDSLQHAGVYFAPLTGSSLWENRHYFKGLHRHLPAANVPRPVPAVTGASLMIDSELYRRVGGLRSNYVQGDYEDSDLCLRLIEAGYENWYVPDVALYHLEGQSYALSSRQLNARYNLWLYTRHWRERLEEVMERYAFPATVGQAAVNKGEREGLSPAAATKLSQEQDLTDDGDLLAKEQSRLAGGDFKQPEKRSERRGKTKRKGNK